MNCKKCKHWKNEQAELEYSRFYGVCMSPKLKFDVFGSKDAVVLDRENITGVHMGVSRFENMNSVPPIVANKSRYCLVTARDFGCVNYKNKK